MTKRWRGSKSGYNSCNLELGCMHFSQNHGQYSYVHHHQQAACSCNSEVFRWVPYSLNIAHSTAFTLCAHLAGIQEFKEVNNFATPSLWNIRFGKLSIHTYSSYTCRVQFSSVQDGKWVLRKALTRSIPSQKFPHCCTLQASMCVCVCVCVCARRGASNGNSSHRSK